MHRQSIQQFKHDHTFGTEVKTRGEVRTWWVIGLTTVTMLGEIAAGLVFGSMALLADGWHMGTHAAALGVAAFAYIYARRHARDARYSFGTGKVGALGGFASAVGLAVVALLVFGESAERLTKPVSIHFNQAILVATLGLFINLLCAFLLRDDHQHHQHASATGGVHQHEHEREQEHEHHDQTQHGHGRHHDHNLRAAYLHVLADALTSVLAILALTTGKYLGWIWMDPVMGLVGSLVIARWSLSLLRDTSRVLLDAEIDRQRCQAITEVIELDADNRVTDLHVWRVGPRHLAAIVSLVTEKPRDPDHYKQLLRGFRDLAHLTIEVHPCPPQGRGSTQRETSEPRSAAS